MSTTRRRTAVDAVIMQTVRLALDESWTAHEAARIIRQRFPSDTVLMRALVRVDRAMAERTSNVAHRVAATLSAALGRSVAPAIRL